jgi:hypothetical protein
MIQDLATANILFPIARGAKKNSNKYKKLKGEVEGWQVKKYAYKGIGI